MNNIIIEQAKTVHVTRIVQLFKENYGTYHYNAFSNEKTLHDLLSGNFIGWIGRENSKIISFAGLYDFAQEDQHLIKLAHLLVDKNYRGYHIGSKMEEIRSNYYSKFKHSLVLASCVDTPPQSIRLKQKNGFNILGIKTNYRKSNLVGNNSVILGKYCGTYKNVRLEMPSKTTTEFIESICKSNNFFCDFDKVENFTNTIKFKYEKDCNNSRIAGYISSHKDAISLAELFKILDRIDIRYKSIRINTKIRGFRNIDCLLLSNGYIPVMYIPYYDKQQDLLEYQKFDNDTYKIYKNLFEKYIRK